MGLLDDAIREHLELKRLRGADPGVVAREEHDALGPLGSKHVVEPDNLQRTAGVSQSVKESDSGSPLGPVSSTSGQETVEINMEAELVAGADSEHEGDVPKQKDASLLTHSERTQASTDEPLQWDEPGDPDDMDLGTISERGANPSVEGSGEHVEDVLEETPDFLRETPEQERLWFEQRPPRDFDFNE